MSAPTVYLSISYVSLIVDAGKTGCQIDRQRVKEIRKMTGSTYPDFLMKNRSYPSQSILGVLYRRALQFKNENPRLFEGEGLDDPTSRVAQVSVRFRERNLSTGYFSGTFDSM